MIYWFVNSLTCFAYMYIAFIMYFTSLFQRKKSFLNDKKRQIFLNEK